MEITHIKTIKLTTEDLEDILRKHFNAPMAEIRFQMGYDPNDDGPGPSRMIFNGVVLVEDQLAQKPGLIQR